MRSLKEVLSGVQAFMRTDVGIALLIALLWKLVISVIGYVIDTRFNGTTAFFDHTIRWDSGWYLSILAGHYATDPTTAAFYPLFPLLVFIVHFVSFGTIPFEISGQIVNTVAIWFAFIAMIKLGRHILGDKKRFWLIALILSVPAAFFLHVFYSEAVFIALSFWAYYLALRHRWLGVGILLGLLTATRLPSVLIIGLCGLEFLRAYDWNPRRFLNKNLLFFLLAPLGFIAYVIFLSIVMHDPVGMFNAYKVSDDWPYQVFNPNFIETIFRAAYQTVKLLWGGRVLNEDLFVNSILPVWSLLLLGLSSFYLLLKKNRNYLPLGVVGILSIIMFTLNSNVVSVHRYILPSLTVYVAVALFIKTFKKPILLYIWCIVGIVFQIILYTLFIRTIFAG